eukprot:1400420-Rhodomonas_salina.4
MDDSDAKFAQMTADGSEEVTYEGVRDFLGIPADSDDTELKQAHPSACMQRVDSFSRSWMWTGAARSRSKSSLTGALYPRPECAFCDVDC